MSIIYYLFVSTGTYCKHTLQMYRSIFTNSDLIFTSSSDRTTCLDRKDFSMKKLLYCTLLAVPLFLSQCSSDKNTPTSLDVNATNSIRIAIATTDGFDKIASGAEVRVTAPDMKEIRIKLKIGSKSISGTIDRIPIGYNRLFAVVVYDYNGNVIYTGTATADIDPIIVASVYIYLKKFEGGSAVVNGSIEDLNAPCDSIWFTTLFGVRSEYNEKEKTVSCFITAVGATSHWRTYNPDTLEFCWKISSNHENFKTEWAPATQDGITSTTNCTADLGDQVKAIVYARCKKHPDVIGVDSIMGTIDNRGVASFVWNSIYPYTYVDTLEFDMLPTETRILTFKAGEDVCMNISGEWCVAKDACMKGQIISKDGEPAGKGYQYPDFAAGCGLIQWDDYSPISFGGDCWNIDEDRKVTLSVNLPVSTEDRDISGKVHVFAIRRGGRVSLPGLD